MTLVVINTSPVEVIELQGQAVALLQDFERAQRFGHDFLANSVAGYDRDFERGHGFLFLGGCLQNVLPAEGSTQGFSITPARSQAKGKANTSLARRKVTHAKGTGVLEFVQGARVF